MKTAFVVDGLLIGISINCLGCGSGNRLAGVIGARDWTGKCENIISVRLADQCQAGRPGKAAGKKRLGDLRLSG